MGVITGSNFNKFKSAEFIYSKIKREFKSFGSANLLDDADFPLYTAEVLNMLGVGSFKEEEAICTVKNGKAKLPIDFKQLYAAYKCSACTESRPQVRHWQNTTVHENDITCEVLQKNKNNCNISCSGESVIERITIKHFVNEAPCTKEYAQVRLLKLSPNVKEKCVDGCINLIATCLDEITINDTWLFTNFNDGDIYLKYYAFPLDDNNLPLVPDVIQIEKAIEWYIKHQLLLNYWLVDDLPNALNKWQKAEEQFNSYLAEARYILKLPSFSTLVNTIRNNRAINKVSFFKQIENK